MSPNRPNAPVHAVTDPPCAAPAPRQYRRPGLVRALLLLGALGALSGCQPLITINPDTGRKKGDDALPLCERVVTRMIRCSTDPEFRGRLERERERAVRSCERAGKKDAERCDGLGTCDAFVRCLRE